jgi:cobalamin synthase
MANRRQKSRMALGVAAIALIFGLEVIALHRKLPSPATPWLLALLAAVALCGLLVAWRSRKKDGAAAD